MVDKIKYTHTNINAKDWKALSRFYQDVFGCKPVGPERNLFGEWFEKATGVKGARVRGQHLALPGYDNEGPTFEIFTYNIPEGEDSGQINSYGFAHVAFEVEDVEKTYQKLLDEGGSACGDIIEQFYPSLGKTLKIVYARDPEGNVIEIQKWFGSN
ncbi:MAG: VOC family protein [Anaerovoracaceae bacterium]